MKKSTSEQRALVSLLEYKHQHKPVETLKKALALITGN